MKAKETQLLPFLKNSPQFIIPIYQRTYSWDIEECQQLWDDIIRSGSDKNIAGHFMGSIVYVEEGLNTISDVSPLLVIDGQQRLTTVTLILEALARHLSPEQEVEELTDQKIRKYYLTNDLEAGERYFKLLLTQTDRETLKRLVGQTPLPYQNSSLRLSENFEFFEKEIDKLDSLNALALGLRKLTVVDIALDRQYDNPQLIFESMNSTGRELTPSDLIRNYILMGLKPHIQTHLYETYWRPMELEFGQQAYGTYFDSFIRHYLTVKTGSIPRQGDVYPAFKKYSREAAYEGISTEELVADIQKWGHYFCNLALGKESNSELAKVFKDIRELTVDTAYPLILQMYSDYDQNVLALSDFVRACRLIETYVFRRAICDVATNTLNKTFPMLARGIKHDNYLRSLELNFLALTGKQRLPGDSEFINALTSRNMYDFKRKSYWFRRLENAGRKEEVSIVEYTIEHILPQNENLSREWQQALGQDWREVHEKFLHNVGNLTLTGYNSEYSDRPFAEKRDMDGGFAQSPLRLNDGIAQRSSWDQTAIEERAIVLANEAVNIWPLPRATRAELDQIKKPGAAGELRLTDYQSLQANRELKELFDTIDHEIFALDSSVTRELFKTYIAYKSVTNFVDIVPQATSLRLTINLPFADLVDPKGIARDVSSVGRHGNGEVDLRIKTQPEVSYAIGLIRQSLERQIGSIGGEMGETP